MPGFGIAVRTNRFPGEFAIAAGGQALGAGDQAYADALARIMERMADDTAEDPAGDASAALRQLRVEQRQSALAALRAQAEEVNSGTLDPAIAIDNAFVIRGKYLAAQERLSAGLFAVGPKLEQGRVVEMIIAVSDSTLPADDPAAQEKRAFYVALDNARTVVGAVAQSIEDNADGKTAELERARVLRDRYLGKLIDIGRIGLQGVQVELGRLALDGFKAEFVAREAGRIKNAYVAKLGIAALIAAAVWLAAFGMITGPDTSPETKTFGGFFLAAIGAAIGTWLSFSIRRVALNFEDLAILETDLLQPGWRVLFVTLLTWVVLLFFWTGAMNIEIGQLKTSELRLATTSLPMDAIALLVGIFCGLSERALATAVSGRAATFVGSVSA